MLLIGTLGILDENSHTDDRGVCYSLGFIALRITVYTLRTPEQNASNLIKVDGQQRESFFVLFFHEFSMFQDIG